MRHADQGNRRRVGSAPPLAKSCHPDADSHADFYDRAKSDTVGIVHPAGLASADFRISDVVCESESGKKPLSEGTRETTTRSSLEVSKAFTREENEGPEIPELPPVISVLDAGSKNYITATGAERLRSELEQLVTQRPKLMGKAADDAGARSQIAKLDQRVLQLEQSLQSIEIVARPASDFGLVRFGATVLVRDSTGEETSYRIVGVDEADPEGGSVSWISPIARALLNRRQGDRVPFKFPSGQETLEIIEVRYE